MLTSADPEKGVLLELKSKSCRQFESYLLAQEQSWYNFLMDALAEGGVMKHLDLAINDMLGILDLLTYYDAEQMAFSIINRYMRFVEKEADD